MDGHPVTEAVQPPPKKEGKSAVILLQETEGGMNIMVSFQNGNNQSAPSEFDPASYLHQLANAAPKLFMELVKDFEDAVSGVSPVADDQGGDAHCDSFDHWWDKEGSDLIDRFDAEGAIEAHVKYIWDAALKSRAQPVDYSPIKGASTKLAELQRAARNDGFFDWWRPNGDAWQAESKDLDPWIMAHQVWQSAIKSRAPSEEAPRFPGVDIDAAHKEKENTQ